MRKEGAGPSSGSVREWTPRAEAREPLFVLFSHSFIFTKISNMIKNSASQSRRYCGAEIMQGVIVGSGATGGALNKNKWAVEA